MPNHEEINKLLDKINVPNDPSALGFSPELVINSFHATKDIRDKYNVSNLLWDLGELDKAEKALV